MQHRAQSLSKSQLLSVLRLELELNKLNAKMAGALIAWPGGLKSDQRAEKEDERGLSNYLCLYYFYYFVVPQYNSRILGPQTRQLLRPLQ